MLGKAQAPPRQESVASQLEWVRIIKIGLVTSFVSEEVTMRDDQ
jgi:hypothetical protein